MEREYVGIDFHRRRSVIVRVDGAGRTLSTIRVADPLTIASAVAEAGPVPTMRSSECGSRRGTRRGSSPDPSGRRGGPSARASGTLGNEGEADIREVCGYGDVASRFRQPSGALVGP